MNEEEKEKLKEEFNNAFDLDNYGESHIVNEKVAQWWIEKMASALTDKVAEERQFILNILDGIDKADEEMGNKGGGTKAIRLALESRILPASREENG